MRDPYCVIVAEKLSSDSRAANAARGGFLDAAAGPTRADRLVDDGSVDSSRAATQAAREGRAVRDEGSG